MRVGGPDIRWRAFFIAHHRRRYAAGLYGAPCGGGDGTSQGDGARNCSVAFSISGDMVPGNFKIGWVRGRDAAFRPGGTDIGEPSYGAMLCVQPVRRANGGEKKRNEILQMKLLQPKFALLDEIDSGLDVDALKIVSQAINAMKSDDFGCIMVSHYERLFELVPPSHVHVLVNGKIILSGGIEVVEKIDQEGYDWVKELGVEIATDEKKPILLESCANKERMKAK